MAEVDVYRDTLVRYLGYANELGESFRPVWPRWLANSTYGVSMAYVLADTRDKALKAEQRLQDRPQEERRLVVAEQAADCLVWQTFASVIVPGFTINRLVTATKWFKARSGFLNASPAGRWLPTVVGLGSIPLIIHPIDELVHFVMDRTTRPWAKSWLKSKGVATENE
mmetsp:Transcript_49720/g.108030  ORF Transcript_49720/g.108030 Transcript_49720/m.108030 type:complete len:168 (-) Transcript_49720:20-523(-)